MMSFVNYDDLYDICSGMTEEDAIITKKTKPTSIEPERKETPRPVEFAVWEELDIEEAKERELVFV